MSIFRTNRKLKKDGILCFGVRACLDCPGAGDCKRICYARKGMYTLSRNKARAQADYELSKAAWFVDAAIHELHQRAPKFVRWNDRGDFYDQAYLDKVIAIARATPQVTHYAYTKSLHLDYSNVPENLHITQSLGGKYDELVDMRKPHAKIFETKQALRKAGYRDGSGSDLIAARGKVINIGLVKH